jgi:hypothetical protein
MQNTTAEESLSLMPCQLVSIRLEESHAIRVMSGRVWITIETDVNDYWLCAGGTLALPRNRHIVIEADSEHSVIDFLPQWAIPAVLEGLASENTKRTHRI